MAKVVAKSRATTPLPKPARAKAKKKPGEKLTAVEHARRRANEGAANKLRRWIEAQVRKMDRARATITKGLEQLFELKSVKAPQRRAITQAMTKLLDGFATHPTAIKKGLRPRHKKA